jgi:exodeoxyribonuclease-3
MRVGILTLNIANPSAARAERQLEWLSERNEQVLVLTETSPGTGTDLILSRLAGAGWQVRALPLATDERGVAIASKLAPLARASDIVDYLPARAELMAFPGLNVIGLYVPSRDESEQKSERKLRFCESFSWFLAQADLGPTVVLGDLNVLEPIHRPHYNVFRHWEYRFYDQFGVRGLVDAYRLHNPIGVEHSWVDYESHGYRFDHAFVSESLAPNVHRCEFDHATREANLSDHSALLLELDLPQLMEELDTSSSLTGEQPSLF